MIEITTLTATQLANAINKQVGSEYPVKDAIAALVNAMYGAEVHEPNNTGITAAEAGGTVTVSIGRSKEFKDLVDALAKQVKTELQSSLSSKDAIADALVNLLNGVKTTQLKKLVESMVDETKKSKVNDVNVSKETSGSKVTVTIGGTSGSLKGEATVTVKKTNGESVELKIQVKGSDGPTELTEAEGTAIANVVALALVEKTVTGAVSGIGYTIELKDKDKVWLKTNK